MTVPEKVRMPGSSNRLAWDSLSPASPLLRAEIRKACAPWCARSDCTVALRGSARRDDTRCIALDGLSGAAILVCIRSWRPRIAPTLQAAAYA